MSYYMYLQSCRNGCLPNAQPDGQVQAQDDEPASPTGSEGATRESSDQGRIQGWGIQGTFPPPPPSPAVTFLH